MTSMTSSRPSGHGPVRAYDWIGHHAAQRPHKEAIRDLATGRSFTYAQLDRRVDATAAYLRSIGLGRGDRVAVLAHNGVEFFDIQFACARTGSIAVLLNWRLTVAELEYILNDSTPALLVHDVTFADTAAELQTRCNIGTLLTIDAHGATNPYDDELARFDGQNGGREELTHDDVITIMYTSGTTGTSEGGDDHPRHELLERRQPRAAGRHRSGHRAPQRPAAVPHGRAELLLEPGAACRRDVVIMRTFDPGEALRVLGDPAQGITHFFAVPAPYQFMMQHPDFEHTDLSRVCASRASVELPVH